ncbi:MAG: nitrogen fixation protein FixH [Rubrivivax sp.]|nr:nitrogen fixation protein FixH [Rubrivivax sp.]
MPESRAAPANGETSSGPWWRFPIVWMVIGGPAIVVVASFVTLSLAIRHPDPVLKAPVAKSKAELPAVQGRNHAATPLR